MKEIELRKVREKYNSLVKEKQILLEYKKYLSILQKKGDTKWYFKLLELISGTNYHDYSDYYILQEAYKDFNFENEENILVYVGTYKYTFDEDGKIKKVITHENDPKAKFRAYLNLETQESYCIELDKCEEFEKAHYTFYMPVKENTIKSYTDAYFNLRKQFLEDSIFSSPKMLINELKTKYMRKSKIY